MIVQWAEIDWDQPGRFPTIGRMPSYEPVDLSAACNTGVEVLGDEPGDVPLGRVYLRGLPFLIGSEPPSAERCFLLPSAPTSVGIGRLAWRVIVAHRLLEPGAPAGHAVGQIVAEYAFHLAGGEVVVAPIRERFELQVVPPGWGRLPFLAVTDTNDHNMPRFEGKWAEAGFRLVEHEMGWPAGYYLWCWENPYTERAVERIEFIPRGGRFIVAGITTSDVDEHPFVRGPARPVRLVTKDERNGVLDIEVDRGVATYPQPLPGEDDRAGWGATEGGSAYSSIAALPSATVAVRQGDNELGRVRWGDVERDGRADAGRVLLELVEDGRNWVHVSVVDDATGRAVPCRVHFRSAEGIPYQPHGHHNHVTQNLGSWHYDVGGDIRLGQRSYAYIDGTCQGWLPRGDVVVDVARGFEYEPLRQTVRIEPGQRDLTLQIGRVADMASEGWWSGDSHVHFLSTPGAQLEQRGEDLRVVNLLQTQWGALFTNTEDFSGRPSVVDGGGYVTYVGQENRQHALGHMVLWGLKEPVMPWCSDGPDEAELGGALDATLSDWADRPRRHRLYPNAGRGRPRVRSAHGGAEVRPAHDASSRRSRPPRLAGTAVRRGPARAGRARPQVMTRTGQLSAGQNGTVLFAGERRPAPPMNRVARPKARRHSPGPRPVTVDGAAVEARKRRRRRCRCRPPRHRSTPPVPRSCLLARDPDPAGSGTSAR